jgi:hypothetical protein
MAEKSPRDAKLSDLMRPKGKPKAKKRSFAKDDKEAKEACG